jgi:hypothetical protein
LINVLVAGLSKFVKASASDVALIEIYSKLPVPPLKLFARIVPKPGPPAHPGVKLSVTGGKVVVVLVVLVLVVLVLVVVVVVVVIGHAVHAPLVVAVFSPSTWFTGKILPPKAIK